MRSTLLAPARWLSACLVPALVASCQTYEPRPLDLAAHRETWLARASELASLHELTRPPLGAPQSLAAFDARDGLTLEEGQLVALLYHPHLQLERLRMERTVQSAKHAGRWDDPNLSISALRITQSVPDRWIVAPNLRLTLPLSGRLSAERELADADLRAAMLRVRAAEWDAWRDVRSAWSTWSAARLSVAEATALVETLDELNTQLEPLAESGELARTEFRLLALEAAQRRDALLRLQGAEQFSRLELLAQLGLAPGADVQLVPALFGAQPTDVAPGENWDEALQDQAHPLLAPLRAEYDVAEAALKREIRKQYPDLTLGPQFESDEGQSRIGLFGALPLPLLNANRRGIAEARVDRELARAAFETRYEILAGRLASARAQAAVRMRRRAHMEAALVPLAAQQLEGALELVRLGEGSALVLLESLARAHEVRLELVRLRLDEALAAAELEHLLGAAPQLFTDEASETSE